MSAKQNDAATASSVRGLKGKGMICIHRFHRLLRTANLSNLCEVVQFENTPKALANFSPGLGAKRQPWVSNSNTR
jgi:hypothetical protein